MKHYWVRTGIVWLVALSFAGQAWSADNGPTERAAAKASANPSGPDLVTLNFVNADIEGVVKAVSEITGKNFVMDPRVKGTVNIVSAKPMSRSLVYQVFLSAMRLQGFAAVEERGMVMIVPEIEAKMHRSPTAGPQERTRSGGDTIQTQVFRLQHESAAQLLPVLRPLITPNNSITAYPGNNTLVVTDYASNLQRIEKIIQSVDVPTDGDSVMIKLQYASALDVAQTIKGLLTEPAQGADPTSRFTVAADARSNSVLARAGDPAKLKRVRELAAMLDSPTSVGGNIHVIYLKNAEAVKLAEVLRAIYSGESTSAQAHSTTPVVASPLGQGVAPAQSTGSRPGIIQADPTTNSIIITAPDAIYNNLRAVVDKLDARRAQVYVEALIAEVSADKAAEFGVQWQDLTGAGKTTGQLFGGTNFSSGGKNIVGVAQNPAGLATGLNIGVIKGTVTVGGAEILNLGILVRALQSDANANILSTPTLLTMDNEEAKIVIGQNVPFITGSYAVSAAATTPTPFQTVDRKDVGLTLKIKPQISEGGAVRLQVSQEVSSVFDKTNPAGIITRKRSVDSTVLVNDGQIVVIGGLIEDSVTDGVEKVPGLGDLPLIGGLFRYNTRQRTKTNLMVFLRPTVLRSVEHADGLSGARYDYILGEQLKAKPLNGDLPDFGSPSLPPRKGASAAAADKPAATQ
ncbi:MAG: type II secretion system secretin GspD [Burkholderiales bacterium]|nr:type II secretion system secretin GspD [Burkholderiales bacterium]